MTDFLEELELQLTAAAHKAVAERARPPRPKRWPTVGLVAVAALAVAVMVLMPTRGNQATGPVTKAKPASLRGARITVYNATTVNGVASTTAEMLRPSAARVTADTVPVSLQGTDSIVYFAKGHAGQARTVGKLLGIDRSHSPPPDFYDGRTDDDVVVVLGEDFTMPSRRLLDTFAVLREATNRTLDTPAGPVRIGVTHTGLCLQVRDGTGWGGTCASLQQALSGKAVASIRAPNGRLRGAVGLVPDGVEAVDLDLADGTTRRLPIGRNVWAVGAEPVVSARFGGTTIRVP
jgi:hypothetical protein